ncbi:Aste57867_23700 [Aphanomyces stellatus]|uniref:Aste57867_23700 protein n=1 Tax=Aphanomyces stellatus TaxID=120398 RepID=A0A485LQ95_9STRA|nr:hypothetical protein As57867_023628 [Aphanomyces stellatus]VFU00345.1 Aste57867_23700 [Aphanomyces stellatus]
MLLPTTILLDIALFLPDASSMFAFLNALGSSDLRGPLEPLWQLKTYHSHVWPHLWLSPTHCFTDSEETRVHLEAMAPYYTHVILDGEFNVAWLRQHFLPTTSTEWRQFPNCGVQRLAEWFDEWAKLRITRIISTLDDVNPLVSYLPKLQPHLEHMTLDRGFDSWFRPSIAPIIDFLATSQHLTELCLKNVYATTDECINQMVLNLTRWLKRNPVRKLTLDPIYTEDDQVACEFITTMFACPTMEELSLTCLAVPPFLTFVTPLPMHTLHMDMCSDRLLTLEQFTPALKDSKVKHLALQNAPYFSHDGLKSFMRALAHTNVVDLDFTDCRFGDMAVKDCVIPYLNDTSLEQLILDENGITDASMTQLADAIQTNATIQCLSVRRCPQITTVGVQALLNASINRPIQMKKISIGDVASISLDHAARLQAKSVFYGIDIDFT